MKIERILSIVAVLVIAIIFTACDIKNKKEKEMEEKNNPEATIEMEDGEKIVIELFPEKAPNTVNNFISLATSGFYDGLIFHRVISGFMIQGGDPFGEGTGGPNYSIKGEFANNGYTNNNVSHTRGVISMARTNEMDSAGSQFFIMHADGDFLNGDYAAFGIVKSGIEEVDKIASVEKDANDKPLVEQKIKTITIDTKGVTYPEPETIKR